MENHLTDWFISLSFLKSAVSLILKLKSSGDLISDLHEIFYSAANTQLCKYLYVKQIIESF